MSSLNIKEYIGKFGDFTGSRPVRQFTDLLTKLNISYPDDMPYFVMNSGSERFLQQFIHEIKTGYAVTADNFYLFKTTKLADITYDDLLDIRNRYLLSLDLKCFNKIRRIIKTRDTLDILDDESFAEKVSVLLNSLDEIITRYHTYTSVYEKIDESMTLDFYEKTLEIVVRLSDINVTDTKEIVKELIVLLGRYQKNFLVKARIIKLRGFYIHGDSITVITDNYLNTLPITLQQTPAFYQKEAVNYMYLVSSIVTFLHEIKYVHGHLSLDAFSVIIYPDNKYRIFLNDLGYMRRGDNLRKVSYIESFSAPGSRFSSFESDIYSLGMTFLQIISQSIIDEWKSFNPQGGVPPRLPSLYYLLQDLLDECFNNRPDLRPLAFQVTDILSMIYNTIPPTLEF